MKLKLNKYVVMSDNKRIDSILQFSKAIGNKLEIDIYNNEGIELEDLCTILKWIECLGRNISSYRIMDQVVYLILNRNHDDEYTEIITLYRKMCDL